MKTSAFLINTSRGPVINFEDLSKKLNEITIGGVALDVFPNEPKKIRHKSRYYTKP